MGIMVIRDFENANQALRKYIRPDTKRLYTLDTMRKLMGYLGNPQNKLKVIHVAGTSGKTSTSYYIASLLTIAGKKIGLCVSPHIDTISERTQINMQPLPETEFCSKLTEFLRLVQKSGLSPSYFEVLVAFAYWLFEQLGVDYAVMEVGLGGLLDGTNVVSRQDKICVITDIGLDHTAILGNALHAIATQKAGIIHPDNVVLMHSQTKEVMNAISAVVHQQSGSKLIQIGNLDITQPSYSIMPPFQQRNFGLALEVFKYVARRDDIQTLTAQQLREATNTHIPARMEVRHIQHKTVIIDGSHNQQKLAALREASQEAFPGKQINLLVAYGKNKSEYVKEALSELRSISDTITLTTFSLGQDEPRPPISPEVLVTYCRELDFKSIEVEEDPEKAFKLALAGTDEILIVTGSFYLLNHIRPLLPT